MQVGETPYSRRVIRSFLWQGGAQFAGQAIAWVSTIVVIRLLSPGDYGLMAMAGVFLGFFLLIADLGFGAAAVQAVTIDREQLRRVFGVVLVTNALGCLFMIGSAPYVAQFFDEPRLVAVMRVLSVNFLLIAVYVLPQSQLVREMDFRRKAHVDLGAMVVSAAAALVLALLGAGVWALVGGVLALHAAKAIAINLVRPLHLKPAFSLGTLTTLAQFGLLVTADRILFFLFTAVDKVIGGRVLGKEALGVYAVALTVAAIPMEKVLPVITQVSFAAFSRIQTDADRVRRNLLRSVQLVSLVCFPAFVGLAMVAPEFVPVVLGPRWVELIVPFQILCLVLPLKAVSMLYAPALFGVGRPAVNVTNMAIALATMSVALLVGVRYGVIGLCLAWLLAYPFVFGLISLRSLRALGVPASMFLERLVFPAGASVTMALVLFVVPDWFAFPDASWLRLTLLTALGTMVYVGLVAILQRAAVRELYTLVRS